MVRIAAAVPFWGDADLLLGAIDSAARLGWPCLVADGPFALFAESPLDTAGILPSEAVEICEPRLWPDEATKRGAFLDYARDHGFDWLFYLDADERIEARAGVVEESLCEVWDWATVRIWRPDFPHSPYGFPLPRLIRVQDGVTFCGPRDFDVFKDSQRIAFLDGEPVPADAAYGALPFERVRIRHERRLRSHDRTAMMGRYLVRRRRVWGTA